MAAQQRDFDRRVAWAALFARWAVRLTLLSLAVVAIGLTLARYDLIAKLAGFSALLGGGLIAILALLAGVAALIAGRRGALQRKGMVLAAILASTIYAGFLASRPLAAGDAPAIHDVTTDLSEPPQFKAIALRSDNLAGVGTIENWRRIHAAAYGRLHPVLIAKPVVEVTADAVRLAQQRGWEIAASDLAHGHVEATESVSFIRFHDDVAIRVLPTANGGSRVDMRSVSRVGVGDLGVNARRIRDFLKTLAAA